MNRDGYLLKSLHDMLRTSLEGGIVVSVSQSERERDRRWLFAKRELRAMHIGYAANRKSHTLRLAPPWNGELQFVVIDGRELVPGAFKHKEK